MRRKDKEITDLGQIKAVIKEARVCHLGLSNGETAYVVPVFFGLDGDNLYIHSAPEGRKLELIKSRPRVCLQFETGVEIIPGEVACKWGSRYRSVIAYGEASLVADEEEKIQGLNSIMAQYSEGSFTYLPGELDRIVIIKVEIDRYSGKSSGT